MLRTRKKKLSGGGKKLLKNAANVTEAKVEAIFCKETSIERLPMYDRPMFVYKWGPPGSGKSSLQTLNAVRDLGYPMASYMNFEIDLVYDALLPFRQSSALIKAEELRAKANYSVREFADVKRLLVSFVAERNPYFSKRAIAEAQELLSEWESGQALNPRKLAQLERVLATITDNRSSALFQYYQKDLHLAETMRTVLRKGFRAGVNILYESTGTGYSPGLGTEISIRDPQFGRTRKTTREGLIELYKNTKERLLGKLVYKELVPVGIDPASITEDTVPLNYRIVVVYPILPKKEIIQRAYSRAMRGFTTRNSFNLPQEEYEKEEYIRLYKEFLNEIVRILDPADQRIREQVDEYVKKELADYDQSYTTYLRDLIEKSNTEISPPFFRGIAFERMEEMIDQAFQYSIDYFLKQYLMIGRIERVIYLSTL